MIRLLTSFLQETHLKKASQKSWMEKPFPLIPVRALKSTRRFDRHIEIPLIMYQYFEKHSDACSGSTVKYSSFNDCITSLELYEEHNLQPHLISNDYRVLYMLHKFLGLSGALSELTWNSFSIFRFFTCLFGRLLGEMGLC